MLACKQDNTWCIWFPGDYGHVVSHYDVGCSVVSKTGQEKGYITTKLSGEVFQNKYPVFEIFEFLFPELLEKSPFQTMFELPNSVEEANCLNKCVETYEHICRFKCIQDSLVSPSTRISEKITSMFFVYFCSQS